MTCRLGSEVAAPERDSAVAAVGRPVLVPDWEFAHETPTCLRDLVEYIGPIVPLLGTNKVEARSRLRLEGDEVVAVVSLGGTHPTKLGIHVKMLQSTIRYWVGTRARGRLIILADREDWEQHVNALMTDANGLTIEWRGLRGDVDCYHAAADVVFAYGGQSALETARNGIPTVAFAAGDRPQDTRRLEMLDNEQVLVLVHGLQPESIASLETYVERAQRCSPNNIPSDYEWCSPSDFAARLVSGVYGGV